ncbi:L-fucose isomerase [Alicyclobacillus hesperidum subsp. aegles]|uniref:L-fucose isomerase n=1 Tax=Alicyclobacillus hesperidum TaxID=89784 RepID=UPI00222B97B1|nr:L-fucose isomerase [Alicyclobacillus hesperidum]GLG02813.1 L-fucose isomerase [Alicyclobacillus hesperidum subsp. aegles]
MSYSKNPKIGIRPLLDGRAGGIRESLEPVTRGMAEAVSELIQSNLRHADGTQVECIVAETSIGGVAEAASVAEQFSREGVGLCITVTPSWCYPLETLHLDSRIPQAIWGFNGTERPGAVYLAAALAAMNQKGIPAFGIYGRDVQDVGDHRVPLDVREKILSFAKAGLAISTMKGKSYLSMGYVSMGIAGCVVEEDIFQDYFGMRNEYVDMTEFVRRIERGIYDHDEFQRAMAWVEKHCKEGVDMNPLSAVRTREQKKNDWAAVVKMSIIARDLMVGNPVLSKMGFKEESMGHNAIAAGFQGQRAWSDHYPISDFMEAILCSSFDWNGIREPMIVATENDSMNAITMLIGHLLTDRAQIFADVRTYWSPDSVYRVTGHRLTGIAENGLIHLTNSGPASLDGTGQQSKDGQPTMKPFWEITEQDVLNCLDATSWCPAYDYFRNGGFSSHFVTRGGMPVTIARLNVLKGVGPVLQLAEGYTVDLPQSVHDTLNQRTNPTWPTTWFVPILTGNGAFRDVYSVMDNWGSNHCAISYGHVGDKFITLASMLRIPVGMHNVSAERIFRPRVWSAFGHDDLTGADFRACAHFGPLYK